MIRLASAAAVYVLFNVVFKVKSIMTQCTMNMKLKVTQVHLTTFDFVLILSKFRYYVIVYFIFIFTFGFTSHVCRHTTDWHDEAYNYSGYTGTKHCDRYSQGMVYNGGETKFRNSETYIFQFLKNVERQKSECFSRFY